VRLDQTKLAENLLSNGANICFRSKDNWSGEYFLLLTDRRIYSSSHILLVLEEAICTGDMGMIQLCKHYLTYQETVQITNSLMNVLHAIKSVEDFYFELTWAFQSSSKVSESVNFDSDR